MAKSYIVPVLVFGVASSSYFLRLATGQQIDASSRGDADGKEHGGFHFSEAQIRADVVIGGAGAAGLAAARTLTLTGKMDDYLILEGRDYVGGKIHAVDFGTDLGGDGASYSIETGAGYISGGVKNPFACEMTKLEKPFQGHDVAWKMRVRGLDGKKRNLGAWVDDKSFEWDLEPRNLYERLQMASMWAYWYTPNCLYPENYDRLNKLDKQYCNNLCMYKLTEVSGDGPVEGIMDLVETNATICGNGDTFVPGDDLDMSVTDMLRAGGYFARDEPDGVCVARAVEYIYLDKEIPYVPWRTSAKSWFSKTAIFGDGADLGDPLDFFVMDPRGYAHLLKRKVAGSVLRASVNTEDEIVIDDPRVRLNSKITKVVWDPEGEKDVVIFYCQTRKRNYFDYPCADDTRTMVKAKDFISTFSYGVLKKSMELEQSQVQNKFDLAPEFVPPLSSVESLRTKIQKSDMGSLAKIFLQFTCKFWEDDVETFFLPYSKDGHQCDYMPLGYSLDGGNTTLQGSHILALAAALPRAAEIAGLAEDPNKIHEQVLPLLNHHFREDITRKCGGRTSLTADDVLDTFVINWHGDPQTRGCWSFQKVGTVSDERLFKKSQFGNLHLSGEGSCLRHTGWVQGGWFSGDRSAKLLLKERRDGFEGLDARNLCDVGKRQMLFDKETCEWTPNPETKENVAESPMKKPQFKPMDANRLFYLAD